MEVVLQKKHKIDFKKILVWTLTIGSVVCAVGFVTVVLMIAMVVCGEWGACQ